MAGLTRRFDVPPELPVAALVAAAALPLFRLFRPGGFTRVGLTSERGWSDTDPNRTDAARGLFAEERARGKRWRTRETRLGWRPGPAISVALVGGLVALVLAPSLPGYVAPPLLLSYGPGDHIS